MEEKTITLAEIQANPDSPEALAVSINMIRTLYRIAYREKGMEMTSLKISRPNGEVVYAEGC